jgi:hypothetical protein
MKYYFLKEQDLQVSTSPLTHLVNADE